MRTNMNSLITQIGAEAKKKKELKQRLGKNVLQKVERNTKSHVDLGWGVLGCKGFHSSFRTTQGRSQKGGI